MATAVDYNVTGELQSHLRSLRTRCFAIGFLGVAATVAGLFLMNPTDFYRSWLWAYWPTASGRL